MKYNLRALVAARQKRNALNLNKKRNAIKFSREPATLGQQEKGRPHAYLNS